MTIDQTEPRGVFNREQTQQLLRPINPRRVVQNAHTKPHLSQQDVLAHLIRTLGFGHHDVEVLEAHLLYETEVPGSGNSPSRWTVGYRALARLYVRDEQQRLIAFYDGGSTGEAVNQPSRGDAHDLAYKSALSLSIKRAAINLGDQFGLSLYNKGQQTTIVKGTLVGSNFEGDDVQADVEQQEVDGGRESDAAGESAEALPDTPAGKVKPTTGQQGTRKRAPRKAAEPKAQPEGPVNPPDEQAPAGTVDEPTRLVAGEPIQSGPMAGVVPTEAQVAAAQQVQQAAAAGVDTTVAEAILATEIPASPGPQGGDDPREPEPEYEAPEDADGPAVLANPGTGEISAVIDAQPQPEPAAAPADANSPEAWAEWAWTEAHRRGGMQPDEYPHNADLAVVTTESARGKGDMMALWRLAEQRGVLTTELRMGLINAGGAAQARIDQAAGQ